MDRGLQEIVDALSLSLGRPVLIDDAELRPLAYSSQFGELDDVVERKAQNGDDEQRRKNQRRVELSRGD